MLTRNVSAQAKRTPRRIVRLRRVNQLKKINDQEKDPTVIPLEAPFDTTSESGDHSVQTLQSDISSGETQSYEELSLAPNQQEILAGKTDEPDQTGGNPTESSLELTTTSLNIEVVSDEEELTNHQELEKRV
jgi:hypothetical protein